jgi:hypothetical protein
MRPVAVSAVCRPANWHEETSAGRHAPANRAGRRVALSHCITDEGRPRADKTAPDLRLDLAATARLRRPRSTARSRAHCRVPGRSFG